MNSSEVSIVICTRNRCESLRPTLASLVSTGAVDQCAELLLIDNGSRDGTAMVFSDVLGRKASARYIFESRSGLAVARNRGVAEATGAVVLFTDDDVRVPRGWVQEMSAPILEGYADAVQGGVRIAPTLLRPWMTAKHRLWLASTDEYENGYLPGLIGANLAVGRHVFRQIPEFDAELGAGALGFAEETLLGMQMEAAGLRIAGRVDCIVEHHFDPSRLTPSAWIQRSLAQGHSQAYLAYHWTHQEIWPTIPRRLKHASYRDIMRAARMLFGHVPNALELRSWEVMGYNAKLAEWEGTERNYERQGLVKVRRVGDHPRAKMIK